MDDPKIAPCAVELRPRPELGNTQAGGLCGTHHFCFASYQRLDRLEWGALRALNEYRLAPGAVREPTFHAGFDIVTLVTGGTLRRLGTCGAGLLLPTGSIELVSAGRGVDLGMEAIEPGAATYIEIWIKTGVGRREPRRQWLGSAPVGLDRPLATSAPFRVGSLKLRAVGSVTRASLPSGGKATIGMGHSESAYQSVRAGKLIGNGSPAVAGDALAIAGGGRLTLESHAAADFLLIRTSSDS